ncbi:hypothetical protein [Streptomyces sp. NPDC058812]
MHGALVDGVEHGFRVEATRLLTDPAGDNPAALQLVQARRHR